MQSKSVFYSRPESDEWNLVATCEQAEDAHDIATFFNNRDNRDGTGYRYCWTRNDGTIQRV